VKQKYNSRYETATNQSLFLIKWEELGHFIF